ncbi:MAG TPA: hypothetical protein VEB60_01210 [Candidatus Paceibacterota bacterium]|nr:hypothetical protein [Candidatus Paceibacterota bacterium]
MPIQRYIESAREKPLHARRRLAAFWSFGLTAMIAAVWLLNFQFLYTNQAPTQQIATNQAAAPLAAVGQSLEGHTGRIVEGWNVLKDFITGN